MLRKRFYLRGTELWVEIRVDSSSVVERPANHAEIEEYQKAQPEDWE